MAAYHPVYDSRHLQADCQSASEPYTRQSSIGYLYLHSFYAMLIYSSGTRKKSNACALLYIRENVVSVGVDNCLCGACVDATRESSVAERAAVCSPSSVHGSRCVGRGLCRPHPQQVSIYLYILNHSVVNRNLAGISNSLHN